MIFETMEKKILFFILFLFLILIGFGELATFKSLDPDFGWHLQTGKLILEKGIPETDWYSFTMPDFPWVANSWLTDIFIYKIYSIFGFQVLLIFFLAIASLSFIILINQKNFLFYLFPLILGFWSVLGFLGIRPQIITIFFVALLWRILIKFLENQNTPSLIFFTPILFLFWVNLHGGFFAGLLILFFIFLLEILKKTTFFKKIITLPFFQTETFQALSAKKIFILFFVLIFSFFASLFNPYGLRIYKEILTIGRDNFLRFHIVEWFPLLFASPSIFIIFYLGLFLGLLLFFRKKVEFSQLILILIFLLFAFLSQRHFPLFVVLSIPIFAQLIFHLKEEVRPERLNLLFGGSKKWIALLISLIIFNYGFYPYVVYALKSDISFYYPEKALSFLKNLPLSENLFNEYGWGGYLIWQLPERKVFIDGRMPSWRKDNQFVFGDYVKMRRAEEGFEKLFDKYEIKIALLRNEKREENLTNKRKPESRFANFLKKQRWFLEILKVEPEKSLSEKLIDLGWQVIYQDETAIILRR